MTHGVTFEAWVPFPLQQVFLFFANTQNLPRIMPPAISARIDEMKLVAPIAAPEPIETRRLAGVGSVIVTSFHIMPPLPFRASWIARITEFDWNDHFVDVQEKGPFRRFRHRRELAAEARGGVNGTMVRDRIVYEIGVGILGEVAQRVFIRRAIGRTFHHRQSVLARWLGEGASTDTSL